MFQLRGSLGPAAIPPGGVAPLAPTTTRGAVAAGTTLQPANLCAFGYTMKNGVCMSQGCLDGRSQCVVMDYYGKTCSYDQLLAYQSHTGDPACGPAPMLPPPPAAPPTNIPVQVGPSLPTPNAPGVPIDISPTPGTQVTAYVPPSQLMPSAFQQIPRWVWVVGGLSVAAIAIALIARR